ncbi:AAA family ATPase, partial [Pseudonocardia alaniniphila]
MILFERTVQTDRLRALWDECRGGNGGVVHVHGPAGSGKSALLQEFCAMAEATGAAVLSVSCTRAEQEMPLAAMGRLLRSAQAGVWDDLPAGVDPEPDDDVGGAPAEPDVTIPAGAITALARVRPVVIAVDDVHRADQWSIRHLLRIASQAPWVRILVVLTERTATGRRRSELLDELLHSSGARTVGTANLSRDAVRELLDVEYRVPPHAPGVEECWRVTAGNPLLLRALAPSIAARDDRPSPEFHAVVRGMLRSLDPPTVHVLRAAAVLGDHLEVADLPDMLGVPPASLGRVVDDLESVGLLRAGAFRDATVRDEVEADMNEEEQVDWHLRAARHLLRRRAPASAVAGHAMRAGRAPDREMVEALVETSEHLADDDTHEARRCLDLARRWARDPDLRADIDLALMRVELQVVPASAVRRLPSVTSAILERRLRPHEIAELVEIIGWHGGPEACSELMNRVTGGPAATGRGAVELDSCRMLLTTVFPDLAGEPGRVAGPGPDLGPRRFPARFRVEMLAFAHSLLQEGWTAATAEMAHNLLLRPTVLPARDARAVFVALTAMAWADRLPSPSVFDRLVDAATARSSPGQTAVFLAARADSHLSRGRIADAERDARDALDAVPTDAWGVGIG